MLFKPLLGSRDITLKIPDKTNLGGKVLDNSRVLFNFYQGNGKGYEDRRDYTQIEYDNQKWDLIPDKNNNLGDTTFSKVKNTFIEDSSGFDTLDVSDFTAKEVRTLLRGLRQGKEFIVLGVESASKGDLLGNELTFVAFQDSNQIEAIFTGTETIVI